MMKLAAFATLALFCTASPAPIDLETVHNDVPLADSETITIAPTRNLRATYNQNLVDQVISSVAVAGNGYGGAAYGAPNGGSAVGGHGIGGDATSVVNASVNTGGQNRSILGSLFPSQNMSTNQVSNVISSTAQAGNGYGGLAAGGPSYGIDPVVLSMMDPYSAAMLMNQMTLQSGNMGGNAVAGNGYGGSATSIVNSSNNLGSGSASTGLLSNLLNRGNQDMSSNFVNNVISSNAFAGDGYGGLASGAPSYGILPGAGGSGIAGNGFGGSASSIVNSGINTANSRGRF